MAAHNAFAEEAYGLPRGEMELADRSLLETFGEVFSGIDYSTANFPTSLQTNAHIINSMNTSTRNSGDLSNSAQEHGNNHSSVELKPQSRKSGGKATAKESRGEDPAIVARDRRR